MTCLRPMRWWDLEAVMTIERAVFTDTPWSPEMFWSELAGVPDTRAYAVAVDGENLLGYGGVMTVGADANLQTLATAPNSQRRGVATSLLEHLESVAGSRSCTRMFLEVAAANSAAQRLYEERGFEAIARRSDYYGPGLDAVVMQKRLSPTAESR